MNNIDDRSVNLGITGEKEFTNLGSNSRFWHRKRVNIYVAPHIVMMGTQLEA